MVDSPKTIWDCGAVKQPRATQAKRKAGTVSADAKRLGVHRTTLSRAIHGHISSPELLQRYRDLVRLRSQTSNPPTPSKL